MSDIADDTTKAAGVVRPMQLADLEMVLDWRNHPDIRRYMFNTHVISLDESRAWFQRCAEDARRHLLIYEEAGQPLGFVNLHEGDDGIADWGFYAAPGAARGTGRRLGAAALRHAFGPLGLRGLRGQALVDNERSIAFHERFGFRRGEVLRDRHLDGEPRPDVVCFDLSLEDWHRHRARNPQDE